MNDELQLKVEKYVSGSMSEPEASDFEKLMETNEELKSQVTLSKQLNIHLSGNIDNSEVSENEYTQELRSFMNSEEAQELKDTLRSVQIERRVPKLRSKRRKLIFIAAAAIVIFLVSAIGLIFESEPGAEQLYAQYYTNNDLPSVIKRDAADSYLEKGALAFQDQNFSEAMAYFENYESNNPEPDIALYLYKGATFMEQNQFFKAIEEFEFVIDSDSIDSTKGFWFKAMAYLKAGDKLNARHILTDIANHVWYFNHEKAKELLEKL